MVKKRFSNGTSISIKFKNLFSIPYLMVVTTIFYISVFTFLALQQHYGLQSQRNDLSVMIYALDAAASGDLLMGNRLSVHLNFIFLILAPIYKLLPFVGTLFFFISLGAGLAGLGLYHIALLKWSNRRLATIPAFAFWLSPVVHDANLYDFHIICVATGLLVWSLWAFLTQRWLLTGILFFLFLISQEDMALVGIFWGLAIAFYINRRGGLLLSLAALTYFILITGWFVPQKLLTQNLPERALTTQTDTEEQLFEPKTSIKEHLNNPKYGNSILKERYGWLGNSPTEVISNLILNPSVIFQPLSDPLKWRPAYYFFAAGAFLCAHGGIFLLAAIPHLGMGLLASNYWPSTVLGTYYWIIVQAVLLVALIFSIKRGDESLPKSKYVIGYFVISTLVLTFVFSPLPYSMRGALSEFTRFPNKTFRDFDEMKSQIPPGVGIGTTMNLFPHLQNTPDLRSILHSGPEDYLLLPTFTRVPKNFCHSRKDAPQHVFQKSLNEYGSFITNGLATRELLAYSPEFILLSPATGDPNLVRNTEQKKAISIRLAKSIQDYEFKRMRFIEGYPRFLCYL